MIVTRATLTPAVAVTFRLVRTTGTVAHGVTFPNGVTVLQWLLAPACETRYATAADMRKHRVTASTKYVSP